MKILYCILSGLLTTAAASAQKTYFIYLQTENGAPFYMKMDDRIYSSTAPGYLILPNLSDSTYALSIGFPGASAESRFTVPVAGRDRGLVIRNSDNGLGLYDLQTAAFIKAAEDRSKRSGDYRVRNDAFTLLLSKVANDSSLLFVSVAAKQEVAVQPRPKAEEAVAKTEVPKPIAEETVKKEMAVSGIDTTAASHLPENIRDTVAVIQPRETPVAPPIDSPAIRQVVITEPPPANAAAAPYKRSVVKRHSESATSEGFGLVFYDSDGDITDTVRLLIPNPKITIRQPDVNAMEDANPFLEAKKDTAGQSGNRGMAGNHCPSTAGDNDFLKLRKNMAAKGTDEAMVDEAKKMFRSKCFSVEQVRNLSTLFLTSAGKYQFFDAAYLHVTDRQAFGGLGTEIRDDYYAKRFKALIGE